MSTNPTVMFAKPRQVVIEEREIPTPSAGELLVRTKRTLVSTGTELTVLSGEFPPGSAWARYATFPLIPGYSNVGEVVAVGPDVDPNWVGKRVASWAPHALYATINTATACEIREDISYEEAVFFAIAEIVMNGVRRANVRFGESVMVCGLGLLGQLAVRLCGMCGARPVFAVDVAASRLAWLPSGVAVVALHAQHDDIVSVVKKGTRDRMADVVFELTGDPELILEEFKALRPLGRFVVLSSPRGETRFDFHDLCNSPSYTIIGAHQTSHPAHETVDNPWTHFRHAELYFDLVADGALDMSRLVSHREPYTEAPRVYQMLLQDRAQAMGVIFDWPE